jgi:hypothetical protein
MTGRLGRTLRETQRFRATAQMLGLAQERSTQPTIYRDGMMIVFWNSSCHFRA